MLDKLERQIGFENEHGAMYGQIYYLDFHGINLFFFGCRTAARHISLFELEKKRIQQEGKTVEIIHPRLKPARKPLLIEDNNCEYKTNYWAETGKECVYVTVYADSPLFKQAYEDGKEPMPGTYKAVWLKEEQEKGIANYYWDIN